ncbi:DUF3017 domain-containing protein [Sanguibacter sp. Leaf3]|uniref:DUF3017 domain-containing protein n=1 Tax=Sanguibacter sp. Leaf3 TaxID=1736209 RepID=UPI0006FCEAE7|nr:DUF3017 domain-containing protein [Sanguibacter sp. Leaf3]KQU00115.1 hypothetical protein ASG53_04380 [Sanguibacter sp. Leaf3]
MTVDDVTAGQDSTGRPLGPVPLADGAQAHDAALSSAAATAPPGERGEAEEPHEPDEPHEHVVAQSLHPMPAQPRRSPAIWAVMGALVVVLVLVVTVSASAGALALAAVLVTAGICRAVLPGDVVGLAVRSRTADVVFYLLLAAAMAFLAQTAPNL